MKPITLNTARIAFLSLLTLTSIGVPSYAQSPTSLNGSYGFLITQTFANSDGQKGLAFLGTMNFDNAGGLTASIVVQNGAGPRHGSESETLPGTGIYTLNPDGTGTLRLDAADLSLTFAIIATDGGQTLQLLLVKCASGPADCGADPVVVSGTARAVKGGTKTLKGTYAFTSGGSPLPAGVIGLLTFDGTGGVSETFAALTIADNKNGVAGVASASAGTLTGTYTINPSGADGTIALQIPADPPLKLNLSFVVTDGGSGLLLLVSEAGTPNRNVTYGSARLQ